MKKMQENVYFISKCKNAIFFSKNLHIHNYYKRYFCYGNITYVENYQVSVSYRVVAEGRAVTAPFPVSLQLESDQFAEA